MREIIAGRVGADAPVAAAAHQRWRRLWPFRNNRWNNNRNVTVGIQLERPRISSDFSRNDDNNRRLRGVYALESETASPRPKEIY